MTAARTALVQVIHNGVDPFANLPATWQPDPTDRWDSHHPRFDALVDELRPRVIVEVGSFLGVSSRHFAAALKRNGIDGGVVCVDTWLAEQVLWNNDEWRPHLRITNGRPEYYQAFMANALAAGLQDYICPLPMPSPNAARYLAGRGVQAELIYIDGSHDEGDVYHDLTLYWDKVLLPGGAMLIDDYQHTPEFMGVVRDTDRFASERHLPLAVHGTKAELHKP